MKCLSAAWLGLLLAFSLRAQSNPHETDVASADKEVCSVSGTVLRQDTGEPLSKARIALTAHEKSEDSVLDVTDAQGHFLLDELLCGSYTLSASHPGFVEARYGQRKLSDPGATLTLLRGQKMTGLVFKLQRTAVITGHVFDENGEIIQGASVRVLHPTGRGKRRYSDEAGRGVTNDLGEFRIFDLQPGRYYLAANYDPWNLREGFGPAPKRRLLKRGYPATFYPSTIDPLKAQTLTLNPGDELTPIDFRMEPVPMNSVSGKILNPPAANALRSGIDVILIPRGPGFRGFDQDIPQTVAQNGTFVLHRVPPGSYNILASYMDRDTTEWVLAIRELEMTNADVEGITLAFAPLFSARGRVTWEGVKQGDLSSFTALLRFMDENLPLVKESEVKPDGSLLFRGVNEGEYRLSIRGHDPACYVKSARMGSTSMVDGKISIHSGSDNSLEVGVSCRAPHAEGQVLTGDSLPAVGVFVVLVPEPRLREQSSNYTTAKTDQNGHFLLKVILPGDYKLFSWDSVEEGDWYDADFLKPFEDKGVSIHLDEGDHKSIGLSLIEMPPNSQSKQ